MNAAVLAQTRALSQRAPRHLIGLTTGALHAASGMHSGARGLTAKEDWQRLFPRYAKRD